MTAIKLSINQILIDALMFQIKKSLLNRDFDYAASILMEAIAVLKK